MYIKILKERTYFGVTLDKSWL